MRATVLAVSLLLAATCADAQPPAPVSNGRELDAWLMRCFKPPPESAGSEIALVFSLDVDGKLKGPPRISYSKLVGDTATQKGFVAAALRMLQDCTPVAMTKEFALEAANKVRALRVMTRARQRTQGV